MKTKVIATIMVMSFLATTLGMASSVLSVRADPDVSTQILYAGQHIEVGTVTVWNYGDILYVKYSTTGGWVLTETHLAVAESLDGIPQTKTGNPIPGKFPYKAVHDPWVGEYTYKIDLTEADPGVVDGVCIAAQAVVMLLDDGGNMIQEETAWADGSDFPGKNWATYFEYSVQAEGAVTG